MSEYKKSLVSYPSSSFSIQCLKWNILWSNTGLFIFLPIISAAALQTEKLLRTYLHYKSRYRVERIIMEKKGNNHISVVLSYEFLHGLNQKGSLYFIPVEIVTLKPAQLSMVAITLSKIVFKLLFRGNNQFHWCFHLNLGHSLKSLPLCTTWTLTKRLEKKLDGNYTRMLHAILNKSWQQHPTRHQLYGHLPPITKTIQVRQTRHAGHCWRSRDELIRDVLLWIPTHGRAKAGRPARTYIQQLCEDTGCCPEDLPRAMNDREEWRERVRDIRATSAIWWWWWTQKEPFLDCWGEVNNQDNILFKKEQNKNAK